MKARRLFYGAAYTIVIVLFSIIVAFGLTGTAAYSSGRGESLYPIENPPGGAILPFTMIYKGSAGGEVVDSYDYGIIACRIAAPPGSLLTGTLNSNESKIVEVWVEADGKLLGRRQILVSGPTPVDLLEVGDWWSGYVIVGVRYQFEFGNESSYVGLESAGLYGPQGTLPGARYAALTLLALVVMLALWRLGYYGLPRWLLIASQVRVVIGLLAIVYGAARPLQGYAACTKLNHIPEGWSPKESVSLYNASMTLYLEASLLYSKGGDTAFLVLAGIAGALLWGSLVEGGLGEFQAALYPGRTRVYLASLGVLALASMLPGLLLLLPPILLYLDVDTALLHSSIIVAIMGLAYGLAVSGIGGLVAVATRRASMGILAAAGLALTESRIGLEPPASIIHDVIQALKHLGNADYLISGWSQLAGILDLVAPRIAPALILGVVAWALLLIAYSRWEP